MANTTTMVGFSSATLDSSAASQTLELDNAKRYKLIHLGFNSTGSADTGAIKISLPVRTTNLAADAVANTDEATNMLYLISTNPSGGIILDGVGQQIKYITMAGTPMFQVIEEPISWANL